MSNVERPRVHVDALPTVDAARWGLPRLLCQLNLVVREYRV